MTTDIDLETVVSQQEILSHWIRRGRNPPKTTSQAAVHKCTVILSNIYIAPLQGIYTAFCTGLCRSTRSSPFRKGIWRQVSVDCRPRRTLKRHKS